MCRPGPGLSALSDGTARTCPSQVQISLIRQIPLIREVSLIRAGFIMQLVALIATFGVSKSLGSTLANQGKVVPVNAC